MAVRQIVNLLDLLEFFAERGKPASLAEVAAHFDWPRSSTFNLLSTLSGRGYLYEPEGRGKFYPSPRWLTLSQSLNAAGPVPEDLLQMAQELRELTGETVCIGAASGGSVVFLEVIDSSQRVRYVAEVGQRIPLHATASGQSILSQWSEAQRSAFLRKVVFAPYGAGTPMSVEAVERQMREGCHRGWFRSASNYSVDLGGVSLPVISAGRLFAVTVAGPLNRVEDRMPDMARTLQEAIARHFGPDYIRQHLKGITAL